MPREEPFDAIVIGSGSGGLTVAIGLAGFGRRVALVEASRVGGDCTNTGCIPSKRLIHRARTDAARPGDVLADVRATRDGLQARERRELDEHPRITLVHGRARLTGPRRVVVDTSDRRVLTAPHVILATGARPRELPIPGLPAGRCLTSDTLFEQAAPPGHLAIVGAGAIGLEMAGAFRRLGTRVTLIDRADRVLSRAHPDASRVMSAALRDGGVDVRLGADCVGYEEAGGTLTLQGPDGRTPIRDVDRVLVAVGRVPNTAGLGLETAGVAACPDGIRVDTWGRTTRRGVWAVGDVTVGSHQTHAANALGRRIVQRIALPWLPAVGGPPLIPTAVFSDPEVAWVGHTADQLSRACHPGTLVRVRVDVADTDRGLTDGVRHGFLAIDAVRLTGHILSATAVGPHASELIATIALAIDRRVSLLRLARQVYPYPTFAGTIGRAADRFARDTLGNLPRELGGYARHRLARPRKRP